MLLFLPSIDGGCVFDIQGLSQLCALDLTNRKLHIMNNIES